MALRRSCRSSQQSSAAPPLIDQTSRSHECSSAAAPRDLPGLGTFPFRLNKPNKERHVPHPPSYPRISSLRRQTCVTRTRTSSPLPPGGSLSGAVGSLAAPRGRRTEGGGEGEQARAWPASGLAVSATLPLPPPPSRNIDIVSSIPAHVSSDWPVSTLYQSCLGDKFAVALVLLLLLSLCSCLLLRLCVGGRCCHCWQSTRITSTSSRKTPAPAQSQSHPPTHPAHATRSLHPRACRVPVPNARLHRWRTTTTIHLLTRPHHHGLCSSPPPPRYLQQVSSQPVSAELAVRAVFVRTAAPSPAAAAASATAPCQLQPHATSSRPQAET